MKNRILLVTGSEAAPSVRKYSKNVHICPIDVAALLSIDKIGDELFKVNLEGVSMILIPGLVSGDTAELSKKLGVPVYKGTKHSSDIPLLLQSLGEIRLSTSVPADFFIEKKARENVQLQLSNAYKNKRDFLMKIGKKNSIYLGRSYPMQVLAEIPDAPLLSKEELKSKAKYYLNSGANIIDIGMISGVDRSSKIKNIVKTIKSVVNVPLSIDSMNKKEILAAVDAGVDLVLSIGVDNMDIADSIDVPFVLVPVDKKGRLPLRAAERVKKLEELVKSIGDKKIILDPVLSPLNNGFVESIKAFSLLKEKHPKIPVMMGVGNVTELIDADSHGINALIAGIASEIGVELLFTVEASVKTQGCVSELSTAAKMMYLAKTQKKNPKDLGLDLLEIKEKKKMELIEDPKAVKIKYFKAENMHSKIEETFYRIYLKDLKITVVQYKKNKPEKGYKGNSAEALYKKICSTNKISSQHAAYLGKELAKAEIALKLGKNYTQDEELF